jgi:predicted PurR-regulated permease PerM
MVPQQEAAPDRVVRFPVRTVLVVLATILAVAIVLDVLWIARQVLTWVFVALFFALALNPVVEWLQRRGLRRRGAAAGATYLLALAVIVGLGFLFVPTLVNQSNDFAKAVPNYVHDLTKGRGRLGFLERKYQIVEKVRHAVNTGGASKLVGLSGTAIAVTKGVITLVVATITIIFMTFFMLLEGPTWVERFFDLLPEESRPRWRAVGRDIYRTVGGYVFGNLLISVIAGVGTSIALYILGVPFAVALGVLVAVLDLIPLAGATLAAILVTTVAALTQGWVAAVIIVVFFVVYQQIENHLLQPIIYGRTVQLSPLVVLIAVLIGAELAGILGALGAIPIAGSIQVIVRDLLRERRERKDASASGATGAPALEGEQ